MSYTPLCPECGDMKCTLVDTEQLTDDLRILIDFWDCPRCEFSVSVEVSL